ncbi:MAG: PDZ domain-containing protein [Candidatus Cloacimonadaceae bacterium]|jgi:hypothetical protein|nr:PDZ domain-containing protein [Candidatus Cloacimonadota bacterium]MDY0128055.1 PDZ domain-containing protein [Candidatus Cloacimonadaceae bacterium]MCB5254454.1 PDZ domain-containing protein [Candidatus Cloacimonadota bacterium]MCK9179060.1 PDZ domain-containing protein [Candidatus Cloacimonadota bacterium]MCK9241858.1 PDZ domain-containing protein [Candidatus Cloacimonadota bacterium]
MKKFTYILLVLATFSLMLNAQEANLEDKREMQLRGIASENDEGSWVWTWDGNPVNIAQSMPELNGSDIKITIGKDKLGEADDAAYFGLFLEDLTFPKAQALNYPHTYGVLITGVVKDSPSWEYRLREDDIIMEINGRQTTNNATFDKIRQGLRAGDQISLAIFRDGKVESLDMTLGARGGSMTISTPGIPKKRKLIAGYGGGTWIPMWINLDMDDINSLITGSDLGFNEVSDSGMLQQGLGGKISIGKNYFLGGQGTWYTDTKKKTNASNPNYHIWLRHKNGMGGVTLDRRIPITKNFISSLGLMLGGSYHELEFLNSDSNYDWTELPGTIANSNNTHFLLKKSYLVAQPRVEVMYRLLSWLGLRAEVGYAFGYPLTQDWRVKGLETDSYEVTNSPDTKYEGLTVTIGPWFGF